jgi:hypothetical protein
MPQFVVFTGERGTSVSLVDQAYARNALAGVSSLPRLDYSALSEAMSMEKRYFTSDFSRRS